MKNVPTLIEYAAFYGSIQIFQYLYSKNVKITGKIWLYVIHSDKPDLIVFLEENHILPEDKSYQMPS